MLPAQGLLGFGARVFTSNWRRLRRPYKITFIPSFRCDLRCRYCRIWRRKPGAEMTLPEIERFFRQTPGIAWLNLSGGEVTLREDLDEILRLARRHCPALLLVNFPTNGFDPGRIVPAVERIIGLGFPRLYLTVALDGPPALHDELRGARGAFERSLETYRALRRLVRNASFRVYLGLTLYPENAGMIPETLAAVRGKDPGFRNGDLHLNLGHSAPHYYGEVKIEKLPPAAAQRALESLAARKGLWPGGYDFVDAAYRRGIRKFLSGGRTPLFCRALSASCLVNPDWSVYPCIGFDRKLGDLRKAGFELGELWNAPSTLKTYEQIGRGECPQCWTPCEAYPAILGNIFRLGGV